MNRNPSTTLGRPRDADADRVIIEAVLDLIAEGVTLSDLSFVAVAARARVGRNTVYRRWPTKQSLLLDTLAAIARPLPRLGNEIRDDLVALVKITAERSQHPRDGRLLQALLAERHAFPELSQAYENTVVRPRRQALIDTVHRGIATGELRADLDSAWATTVLISPALWPPSGTDTHITSAADLAEKVVDLVLIGLCATR
ncbi:TetR-like C-terminal domain-containing protein [Nocardia terpenica]|uniref:TetR-like C-terminal domain-containing protein n=1 Tax=Nocardia terpenica TaxID=455432 RepID=UPI000836A256|nr:TetR-like C-terminal domain-containing protein [Nocardia terpenica]NQE93321.1 TetR/AcrR family transcriptional regulator [Nocardia terpenica]